MLRTTVRDPATFKEEMPAPREALTKAGCGGACTKCGGEL